MELHELKERPDVSWAESSIRSILDPGEELRIWAEFNRNEVNGSSTMIVWTMVVLTTRNLRFVNFKLRLFRKQVADPPVERQFVIPLAEILALGVTEHSKTFFDSKCFAGMHIRWSGGSEEWRTVNREGLVLIRALADVLAKKTAVTAAGTAGQELERLAKLTADGVISAEEFQRGKELFLGKTPDSREEALAHLRQLHSLHTAGVLSEMEFNMKKWDVLSKN